MIMMKLKCMLAFEVKDKRVDDGRRMHFKRY
jgi:hypothetical protein